MLIKTISIIALIIITLQVKAQPKLIVHEEAQIFASLFEEEKGVMEVPEFNSEAQKMPMNYSGFKIQLVSTKEELEQDHKIFNQFDKVYIDQREAHFFYMIGDFKSERNAVEHATMMIDEQFPNWELVIYLEGIYREM